MSNLVKLSQRVAALQAALAFPIRSRRSNGVNMAATVFRVNPSKAFSGTLPPQMLNIIENLNQSFAQLKLVRTAMVQEQDDASGTDTAFVTIASMFGFVSADGTTLSSATAHAAFTEIDSMVQNCQAALEQLGARFKQ